MKWRRRSTGATAGPPNADTAQQAIVELLACREWSSKGKVIERRPFLLSQEAIDVIARMGEESVNLDLRKSAKEHGLFLMRCREVGFNQALRDRAELPELVTRFVYAGDMKDRQQMVTRHPALLCAFAELVFERLVEIREQDARIIHHQMDLIRRCRSVGPQRAFRELEELPQTLALFGGADMQDKERILLDHPELLSQLAEDALAGLAANPDHLQLRLSVNESRLLLQRARTEGIEVAFAAASTPSDPFAALAEPLTAFCKASDIDEKRAIVRNNPELLGDYLKFIETKTTRRFLDSPEGSGLGLQLGLLLFIRLLGIDEGFRLSAQQREHPLGPETVQALKILQDIGDPESDTGILDSYRSVIAHVERTPDNVLWALLSTEHARQLLHGSAPAPTAAAEAVQLCEAVLDGMPGNMWPVLTIRARNTLLDALTSGGTHDDDDLLDGAIEQRLAMLDAIDAAGCPVTWAETMTGLADNYRERGRYEANDDTGKAIHLYQTVMARMPPEYQLMTWIFAIRRLASTYLELRNPLDPVNIDKGLELLHEGLDTASRLKRGDELVTMLSELSWHYRERAYGDPANNIETSLTYAKAAVEATDKLEAVRGQGITARYRLAEVYIRRFKGVRHENIQSALSVLAEARREATGSAAAETLARLMILQAVVYMEGAGPDRAEDLEVAIHHLKEAKAHLGPARSQTYAMLMTETGNAFSLRVRGVHADNLEEAVKCYESAVEVLSPRTSMRTWAGAMCNLGVGYSDRVYGDPVANMERAMEAYEAVLGAVTREFMPVEWAHAMLNLAVLLAKRGIKGHQEDLERAIECGLAALQIRTRESMPRQWAVSLRNLAVVLLERHGSDPSVNIETAIGFLNQALQVLARDALPLEWADTVFTLANAYHNRLDGDPVENVERSIELHLEALTIRTRTALPREWAMSQLNLGIAYQTAADRYYSEESRRIITEAISAIFRPRDGQETSGAVAIRGDPASAAKVATSRSKAEKAYRAALEVFSLVADPSEHQVVQSRIGDLCFRQERWAEAGEAYRAALAATELLYEGSVTLEARIQAVASARNVPAHLAYTLAKLGNVRDSVEVIERGRGRMLEENLRLNEAPVEDLSPDERTDFENARQDILALQSQLRRYQVTGDRMGIHDCVGKLDQAQAALHQVVERVRARVPSFMPIVSFQQIQEAAQPFALTYLLSTWHGGLALVVPGTGNPQTVWLPHLRAQDLSSQLNEYLKAYRGRTEAPHVWGGRIDAIGRWLFDAVMRELLPAVSDERWLAVVPVGSLAFLPLLAAWEEGDDAAGRSYAIDRIGMSYAPNARTLLSLRRLSTRPLSHSLLAIDEPQPVTAPRLLYSSTEVTAAASFFDDVERVEHSGATRDAVLAAMPQYSVSHLSCHGAANLDAPLTGGLLMSKDKVLSIGDLLDVRLPNVSLAVLSACETNVPSLKVPDEALSLASGMLSAGVQRVVSTQWAVSEISTLLITIRFYELCLIERLAPPDALRKAQTWLRDTTNDEKIRQLQGPWSRRLPSNVIEDIVAFLKPLEPRELTFSHPYHWAGYSFAGVLSDWT
jgi:tetratricopeptide (TPR) repeat protein